MYFPNAFTPNGDNLNELFPISNRCCSASILYNQSTLGGEKKYLIPEPAGTDNWDGTYQGKKVPNETFMLLCQLQRLRWKYS